MTSHLLGPVGELSPSKARSTHSASLLLLSSGVTFSSALHLLLTASILSSCSAHCPNLALLTSSTSPSSSGLPPTCLAKHDGDTHLYAQFCRSSRADPPVHVAGGWGGVGGSPEAVFEPPVPAGLSFSKPKQRRSNASHRSGC